MTPPKMMYGTAWKEERTADLTEKAIRAGFRAIDTANQRRHYHEVGVGEGIARAGVPREELFLQTKFTYVRGQDHRLPYDPKAPLARQVEQSMASSLEHLGTTWLDSYVLHGPANGYGWSEEDAEVWGAMVKLRQEGKAKVLGVSNVGPRHLEQLLAGETEKPAYVQNRCFARLGWDRPVRMLCQQHGIVYQGFSLLTANPEVLRHRFVADLAKREKVTGESIVFAFARQVGMLPLTGTSSEEHMREDLASVSLTLSDDAVHAIETLAG
jgi:diketogulonate reductase-like aldo/keto reductase